MHNAVRIIMETGVQAEAITDGIDSLTVSERAGLEAVGEIGQVTFFNGIITFTGGSLVVRDTNPKKATGAVGTVTVVTEQN